MKAIDKLRVYWCKKEDFRTFYMPSGNQTRCDGHYMNGIITEDVINELDERGYDVSTIKFSIEPKKGNERFVSQRTLNNE